MAKEKVFLAGASGSMGSEAFKNLWTKRDKYDIVLLQRPSKKNKELFEPYEKACGIESIPGKGVVEAGGLKIVWGDATLYKDVLEACRGIDWCLCTMALISPAADHDPAMCKAINTTAIQNIVKAIEAQPNGAEHIKFVYTGTVAETGDRLQSIHWGRIGDPLKPSIFDFYACAKIMGERAVIESNIKHWASVRQTWIMIPDIMSLMDPIMFHQPIDSFMENGTAKDSGRLLGNCLAVPEDSDFWRRVYNIGGGPSCRITYIDYLDKMMRLMGMGDYRKLFDRKWFALRNFHMQYYEDSYILNEYLHNWGQSTEDFMKDVWDSTATYMKILTKIGGLPFIQPITQVVVHQIMKMLAAMPDGTLGWYNNRNDMRISAFYGSYEKFESIPDWDVDMPQMDPEPEWHRLDHGYDETKKKLDIKDLQDAAEFRGGRLLSKEWSGDMYSTLRWRCAFDHEFEAKPYTVLKAGHWCPECLPPPWNYDEEAKKNPFFAQVWYPNHDKDEHNFYPEDCYTDILATKPGILAKLLEPFVDKILPSIISDPMIQKFAKIIVVSADNWITASVKEIAKPETIESLTSAISSLLKLLIRSISSLVQTLVSVIKPLMSAMSRSGEEM